MTSHRFWRPEEDQLIIQLSQNVSPSRLLQNQHWNQISHHLKEQFQIPKTSKQCKARWNNHLRADLDKESRWTDDEINKLIQLQQRFGNQWATIAQFFSGRTNVGVKVYFFSTLRKSIRIINSYIVAHRSQSFYQRLKPFLENCICKLVAQEQGKTQGLKNFQSHMQKTARYIKSLLLKILCNRDDHQSIEEVIPLLLAFNNNCRKIRKKKSQKIDLYKKQIVYSHHQHPRYRRSRSDEDRQQSNQNQRESHENSQKGSPNSLGPQSFISPCLKFTSSINLSDPAAEQSYIVNPSSEILLQDSQSSHKQEHKQEEVLIKEEDSESQMMFPMISGGLFEAGSRQGESDQVPFDVILRMPLLFNKLGDKSTQPTTRQCDQKGAPQEYSPQGSISPSDRQYSL